MFRGLFIGIDRYASEDVNWLGCARRDATALHALTLDTLGGDSVLLVDQAATKDAIEGALANLTGCNHDDDVVIAFSGHGTETHQLVCYDTLLDNLSATSVSLEALAEWFERIPAKRLILVLDCCFSGGMGAKVLHVAARPRDLTSVEARLNAIAGEGRLIVTASGAREAAYESAPLGHGFFTYYLLQALEGAEEVRDAGRVSVYRLLEFVTRSVIDAARRVGRPQNPTVKGNISGELLWPVFQRGANFRAAFPERSAAVARQELISLVDFGFPEPLVTAWAGTIPSLNALQVSAINEFGILAGHNLLVSAPTSSGKTMIGELAALRSVLDRRRAIFLMPLKALVSDKKQAFDRTYSAFGVRTIEATGETEDISPLMRGKYDLALLTYEKFAAIALTYPHVLEQVGTIVVDEVQMIADPSRGANLEFLFTLLRMRQRRGVCPQIVALSAVIGDANGFDRWLGARLLRRIERPVPLDEGLLLQDGSFRYLHGDTGAETRTNPLIHRNFGKGSSQDWVIPLAQRLAAEGKQVIVFRETKGEARGCANYLAENLGLPPAKSAIAALPAGDPSRASTDLRNALERGVAFHNADLDREERRAIEESFRVPNATLRVIAATTTLAMGINTPASAVIIVGLEHPGEKPYTVAEYKNLVGRAGRLGMAERGTSYLIALDARTEEHFWRRYVRGVPEDLVSRFISNDTDARTLILRVLVATRAAAEVGIAPDEIVEFLEASFGAFQATMRNGQWQWSHDDFERALSDLLRHGLVERLQNGNYGLTPLGRLAGEGLCEVESITRLVDAIRPLAPDVISEPTLITLSQMTVELSDVYFPINAKSTQKEPQAWLGELRSQGVPGDTLSRIRVGTREPSEIVARTKKAVACLLYIGSQSMEEIERILTQFGGAFGGVAGPVRAVSSRTCDVLPTVARVAEIVHPGLDLTDRIGRLLVRLENGIGGAAVDLAKHIDFRLSRADYRRLTAAHLLSADEIEKGDDSQLVRCVAGNQQKMNALRRAPQTMWRAQVRLAVEQRPLLEPFQS